MYKDKGGIKRNTNMLFMNRFISSKTVKIVEMQGGEFRRRRKEWM